MGKDLGLLLDCRKRSLKTSNDESIFAWGYLQTPLEMDLGNMIFSTSPQAFQNCGDISPHTRSGVQTSHYSLTNKSLHLELGVYELGTVAHESIGRLNCS